MTNVFSGIQPTGPVHLGNYLGALQHWPSNQGTRDDALFCIVDLHALTVYDEGRDLNTLSLDLAALLLAIGIDPSRSILFVQSHVPQHTELAWLLECTVTFGELSRMTQFKDKSVRGQEGVSAGLFTYPALMAADILLYDAARVPVGEDQTQHLEVARTIAKRFNKRYGAVCFQVPQALVPPVAARVMDLQDPTKKMSKSSDSSLGTVFVLEDPQKIRDKIGRAVTDQERQITYEPDTRRGVANLLDILSAVTGKSPAQCATNFDGSKALKDETAEALIAKLEPIQKSYIDIRSDESELVRILHDGADRARLHAEKKMGFLRSKVNLVPPPP